MWVIARVGVIGISDDDLNSRPFTGWRRKLGTLVCEMGRLICFFMGLWVTRVGNKVRKTSFSINCASHFWYYFFIVIDIYALVSPTSILVCL